MRDRHPSEGVFVGLLALDPVRRHLRQCARRCRRHRRH